MNRPEWIAKYRFYHDHLGVQDYAREQYERIRSIEAGKYAREQRHKLFTDGVAVVFLMASWVAMFILGWMMGR